MKKWSVGLVLMGFVLMVGVVGLTLAMTTPAGAKTAAHTAKGRHPPANAALESMLLTVSDLPSGWAGGGPSGGPSRPPSCLARYDGGKRTDPTVQASFADGDFRMFDESLTQGGRSAPAKYRKAVTALDHCSHVSFGSGKTTLRGRIEPMSLPHIGQASNAYQLSLSIEGFTLDADLTIFRQGTILGLTLYGDLGTPDVATVVQLDREAVAKVTRAGAARAVRSAARTARSVAANG